jgi:hypothetical protein
MDPNKTPDFLAPFVGAGIVALIFSLVILVLGFIVSAFVMSLYIRMVIRFMRRSLDREYRYMRGQYPAPAPRVERGPSPQDW